SHRMVRFIDDYNAEIDRWIRNNRPDNIDEFVSYDKIKWSRNLKRDLRNTRRVLFEGNSVRYAYYRPFTMQYLYFADVMVDEQGMFGELFPLQQSEQENVVICLTAIGSEKPFISLVTNGITDY